MDALGDWEEEGEGDEARCSGKLSWLRTAPMSSKVLVGGAGYFACILLLASTLGPALQQRFQVMGLIEGPDGQGSMDSAEATGTYDSNSSEPENTLEMGTMIKGEDSWDWSAVIIDDVNQVIYTWDNLTLYPNETLVQQFMEDRIALDTPCMNYTEYVEWYSKLTPKQIQRYRIQTPEEVFPNGQLPTYATRPEPENTLEMGTMIKGENIWDCNGAVYIDHVNHVFYTWDNLTLCPDKERVQRILDNRIIYDTQPMNRTEYEEWYSKLTPQQIEEFHVRPTEEVFAKNRAEYEEWYSKLTPQQIEEFNAPSPEVLFPDNEEQDG